MRTLFTAAIFAFPCILGLNKAYAQAYPSSYEDVFDNLDRWTVTEAQTGDVAVLTPSGSPDERNLMLKSATGLSGVTYDGLLNIKTDYRIRFTSLISSYSSNGWPLRIIVKSGSINTIIQFEDDGIYYFNASGAKTYLTAAPNTGVWHDYEIRTYRDTGSLSIDGGTEIPIPGLKIANQAASISLTANALSSSGLAQSRVDHFAIIPEYEVFREEWASVSNWTKQNAGTIKFEAAQEPSGEKVVRLYDGSGATYWTPNSLDLPDSYAVRFATKVSSFGSGIPASLRIFDGTHKVFVSLRQAGITIVDGSGSLTLSEVPILGEWIDLEVRVQDGSADLVKLSAGGVETTLHSWTLSLSSVAPQLRIYADGIGGDAKIKFLTLDSLVPLINHANNETTHETLALTNGELVGFSEFGGGYGAQLKLDSSAPNILGAGFGAGWVSALRSRLHSGYYNPTQAGASDAEGTPTRLTKTGGVVIIEPFAAPLFGLDSRIYDWIENEPHVSLDGTIYNDKNVCDSGNSDVDGLFEAGLGMEHELRSELDFFGEWEAVQTNFIAGASALRHEANWTYSRSASTILQFNREGGILSESDRVLDLMPTQTSGNQTARDDDLSKLLNTYSYRLKPSEGYRYVMWRENGSWNTFDANDTETLDPPRCSTNCNGVVNCTGSRPQTIRLNVFGSQNDALNQAALGGVSVTWVDIADDAEESVVVLSKTGLTNDPDAVGLVFPYSNAINSQAVEGADRQTGNSAYSEDRRINAYFEGKYTNGGNFLTIFLRMWHLGLQAPDNGDPDVEETLSTEVYQLFGTPLQIFSAAEEINDMP